LKGRLLRQTEALIDFRGIRCVKSNPQEDKPAVWIIDASLGAI